MVQSAFVDFVKSETVQATDKEASPKEVIVVTEQVTGTGRRPILPPSIMKDMPVFKTDCGKTLEDIKNDPNMDKKERQRLSHAIKNREKRWIGLARANQMPEDPNQPDRIAKLELYRQKLKDIPTIDSSDNGSQQLKVLDDRVRMAKELQREIELGIAEMEERTDSRAKLQDATFYLTQMHYLLDTLAIHENTDDPADVNVYALSKEEAESALKECASAYIMVKGKNNQREFALSAEDILNEINSEILRPAVQNRNSIIETERSERIQERYIHLTGEPIPSNVVSKSIDVSSDLMNLLFPPRNNAVSIHPVKRDWPQEGPIFGRIEQLYKVVLTPNRGQSITKTISALGEKSAVNAVVKYLSSNALTTRKIQLERDQIPAVIGVAGANKRQLEEIIKAPIAVMDSIAHMLATPEQVEQFKVAASDMLKELRQQTSLNSTSVRVPLKKYQANFLASRSTGGVMLKNIARPLEVSARVLNARNDEPEAALLLIQGVKSQVEQSQKEINTLIGKLSFITMKGPARASRKLLSGLNPMKTLDRINKQLEDNRDLNDIPNLRRGPIDEFGEVMRQNKLSAFFLNPEILEAQMETLTDELECEPSIVVESELEDDEEGILVIVGISEAIDNKKDELCTYFEHASYVQETIEINNTQAQILPKEKLASVVEGLSVNVRFAGRDRPGTPNAKQRIAILGNREDRKKAKELITEWVQENAVEEAIILKSMEMRQKLMSNGRILLNYFQDVNNVHLMFSAPANATEEGQNPLELIMIGSRPALDACKREIIEKDEEIFQQIANNEVRTIEVAQRLVGAVTGPKGSSLRHIEDVSGAFISQRRETRNNDVVLFDIKGDKNSIELAIGMIEGKSTPDQQRSAQKADKISPYEKLPFQPTSLIHAGFSRGRGRIEKAPTKVNKPVLKNFDDDFPDFDDFSKPKSIIKPVKKVSIEPVNSAPAVETPISEAPVSEAPISEASVSEAPVSEASASEAPISEASVSEASASEAPISEAPGSEAPGSEAPTREATVSDEGGPINREENAIQVDSEADLDPTGVSEDDTADGISENASIGIVDAE